MTKSTFKTTTAAFIALISLFLGSKYFSSQPELYHGGASLTVGELFTNQISGVMVQFDGSVIKTLSDDNDGSRHQRFIVEVDDGHTVLIAHNIDLARRVPINVNNQVTVYGQYEWNEKGGVVHWTHHDPQGQHEEGWIEYQGKIYH